MWLEAENAELGDERPQDLIRRGDLDRPRARSAHAT